MNDAVTTNSVQFGRECAVTITSPSQSDLGYEYTGLRTTFKITRSRQKQPNTSTITLTNLSSSSRAVISKPGNKLTLAVGYSGTRRIIFKGDIARVTPKKSGTEYDLEMECGDGLKAFTTARLDTSFNPGTDFGTVFDTVVKSFGIGVGQIIGVNRSDVLKGGASLTGLVRNSLDKLTARQNLEWSIQDENLQIIPRGKATNGPAILLNASTGLIGNATKTMILRQDLIKPKDGTTPQSGVNVQCLLNPLLIPGCFIKVESREVNGVYVVEKVEHHGDTRGGDWFSDVEAHL